MRSTNDIMISVTECEPCTEEELRLCIASLGAMLHFAEQAANDIAESSKAGLQTQMLLRIGAWRDGAEGRFKSIKMPVDEYLGPGNTPGTPEHEERLRLAAAIFNQATSEDL